MAESLTILCVDDEETALFLRKAVLQKFGFKVITASSAKQALETLRQRPVDLLLSDLLMPEITGSELARIAKEMYPQLPVVIVSGVNEIPTEAGYADLFVSKLEGPAALCNHLRRVLDKGLQERTA
ncbi:MAG: response regulator [Terriglobales bacterium]